MKPILEEMPCLIFDKIMSNLKTKDLLSCRLLCKRIKAAVDNRPIKIRDLTISSSSMIVSLESNTELRKFYQYRNMCLVEYKRPQRRYRVEIRHRQFHFLLADEALKEFNHILQLWPKLQIEYFTLSIQRSSPAWTNTFVRRFKNLIQDGSIRAKEFNLWHNVSDSHLAMFLGKLMPGVLKKVRVSSEKRGLTVDKVKLFSAMELEQFKRLEMFQFCAGTSMVWSQVYPKMAHLKKCDMAVSRMSVEDVEFWLKACSNMKQDIVQFRFSWYNKRLEEHFRAKGFQFPHKFAENSTHYMTFEIYGNVFSIRKWEREDVF